MGAICNQALLVCPSTLRTSGLPSASGAVFGSMSPRRQSSCGTGLRAVCTGCYLGLWVVLIFPLVLTHMAVSDLVPVLKDLPDNLHKGFYEEFKFDLLKTDAKNVKDAAEQGLSTCGVTTAQCETGAMPTYPPYNTVANTSLSLQKITDAFDNSLSIVKKVSSDKYFSVGPLIDTAKDLEEIINETKKLEGEDRCLVTNEAFCEVYKSSDSLTEGADMATGKIDEFQDSDAVNMFKDNADVLNAMHGIPYAMVIALLFFSCFWYKDAACCCCGGACLGGGVLIFHAIFWLVSIVGCAIVTSIGYAFTEGQEQVDLKGAGLAGPPLVDLPGLLGDRDHASGGASARDLPRELLLQHVLRRRVPLRLLRLHHPAVHRLGGRGEGYRMKVRGLVSWLST